MIRAGARGPDAPTLTTPYRLSAERPVDATSVDGDPETQDPDPEPRP